MSTPGVCLNIMKERQEGDGVGTLKNPEMFLNQDYNLLHQYYLVRGWRYIDDMFPPDSNSIGKNLLEPEKMAKVEWIRPTKLVPNPLLIVDGMSRFDFAQGEVGNCWFLAALGALTFQKDIMKNVFPSGQLFQKDYAGIFHFRFWRFGKWVDVVIDDKLPTINGRLIFAHSKTPSTPQSPRGPIEFWPALLEKAYAKVCGSYEDMKSGNVSEALLDFTGGVHMSVNPGTNPQGLWDLIYRAAKAHSLMGCGTPGKSDFNKKLDNGLVEGHAYAVTGVTKVTSQNKQVELVRLFNPWGGTEWNGDWSDRSPLWNTVSAEEQNTYLKAAEDGEFWMSMEDFCRTYSALDICSLCPDFLNSTSKCHWTSRFHDGQWLAGSSAGGRPECADTFWTNPQYRVKINQMSKACEQQNKDPNILVTLMQKPDKRNRRLIRKLYIGFSIFKIPSEMKNTRGKFPASFFKKKPPVAYTKVMYDSREVMGCFTLEPGEYITVPHTFDPNQSAFFILGILSKMETHTEETYSMDMSKMNIVDFDGAVPFSRQMSDQYKDLNAEQLQKLLNEKFVEGDAKHTGGFSLEVCHSVIALMDHSLTGTLDAEELSQLLNKVRLYKETFFHMDKNRDGILSQTELRNAVDGTGVRVSESLLKLMSLRYGDSSGRISMESFICLAIRLDRMGKIFRKLANGHKMELKEDEWLCLTMYS
ncbi:calpain-1 catalytic subunit-like [Astyanax mexicanus]|uniref:calpain-1 catalytic subunit-like n=1 Tax=Astyanax mexicanus TaxID=7994 RepID=UPI0020CB5A65|nr:calpain-1 catalytic subunit-like [Astyanax mexicanus]